MKEVTKYKGVYYCSVTSAAKKLHMSRPKVRQMIVDKELDYTQHKVNGPLKIPLNSLMSYIRKHKIGLD